MARLVVVADTHLGPGPPSRLPRAVYGALEGADGVLHAGDIVSSDLLDELAGWAPTWAVRGNNDVEPALRHLPEERLEVVDDVRIGMVHDSGPRPGRERRLHRRFPDADVVVFGHSHIPWNEPGVDGQLLFNPGSPTQRRRQPHPTIGVLEVSGGRLTTHQILPV
jgi:putative phosphoesterase